jgi:hypothetical protein
MTIAQAVGGEWGFIAKADLQLTRYDSRLARDALHDRHGALADERDRDGWERPPWHATQQGV